MQIVLLFGFGCCLGSFYCVIAERVPKGQSLLLPASRCPHCQHLLRCYELVPLLSALFLHLRCRYCATSIPPMYLLSELTGGLICPLCFSLGLSDTACYFYLLLTMGLILSLTDLFYRTVEPNILFFFAALLLAWHLYFARPLHFTTAIATFTGFCLINTLIHQAIGGGDVLLLSFWALFLGHLPLLLILFTASSSALLYILCHQLFTHKKIRQIPFVPFLFFGLLVQISSTLFSF